MRQTGDIHPTDTDAADRPDPARGGSPFPSPRPASRWRWSRARRALVGGGTMAAVLSLGAGAAGAATARTPSASRRPDGSAGGPIDPLRPTAAGSVTAVSADRITLRTRSGATVTVTYSSTTSFRTSSGSSSAASVARGDLIAVRGTTAPDGTVQATLVVIGGTGPQGPGAAAPNGSRPGPVPGGGPSGRRPTSGGSPGAAPEAA